MVKKQAWRSLYFTNRKEYYRRKKISIGVKKYWAERKIYFVNFDIAECPDYIKGSLSSPNKIPLEDAIKIIKANCPPDYSPVDFYEAEEKGVQTKTILIILRDETEEIINEVLNV